VKQFLVVLFSLNILNLQSQEVDSISAKSSFAIFPALSYAPETSVQFGAIAIWVLKPTGNNQANFQRENTLTPYFLYTFKNQIITAVNITYYFPKGNAWNATTRFYDFPDFYFGLGNDKDPDTSEAYTNVYFQTEGQYLKPISNTSFIGAAYDLQYNNINDVVIGGLLNTDDPVGVMGGGLFGVGPTYRYDSRNNTIYPISGKLLTIRSLFTLIGNFSYTSHLVDGRKYLTLGNDKNVLAFQMRANFTTGKDIPFYKLPQLGGDERLRGISNASLYRQRQMIYTQVEFRRPLFWRFGFTVFAGAGDVAYNLNDFTLSEFKYVAGIGGRFLAIPKKKLNIRLDIGVARGGQTGIYVGLGEAF